MTQNQTGRNVKIKLVMMDSVHFKNFNPLILYDLAHQFHLSSMITDKIVFIY